MLPSFTAARSNKLVKRSTYKFFEIPTKSGAKTCCYSKTSENPAANLGPDPTAMTVMTAGPQLGHGLLQAIN